MAQKELIDLPPSYTNLSYDSEAVAGPSAPILQGDTPRPKGDLQSSSAHPTAPFPEPETDPKPLVYNAPSLVFENIYEACIKYANDHCCYGKKFLNQMKLTDISNKGVFHYKLESFGEIRETVTQTTPYKDGSIDGPEYGRPPVPWDMTVTPPVIFMDCNAKRVIPHTDRVYMCSECHGNGQVPCPSCIRSEDSSCCSCSGGRNSDLEACLSCCVLIVLLISIFSSSPTPSFSGTNTSCSTCSGSGRVTCSKCKGKGKFKDCQILNLTWKNHLTDFVTDIGNMPEELILEAAGIEMFKGTGVAIQPITNAPEETINTISKREIEAHKTAFPNEMIIQQRHVLRAVPFTRVTYQWKEMEGEFYVYGTDRKVYFENYPQSCCCCIC